MNNKQKIRTYNKRLSDLKMDFFLVTSTTQHVIAKEIKVLESRIKELEDDK